MNILCHTDNKLVPLNTNNLLDMAKYGIGASMLQKKFESRRLLNMGMLNNLENNFEIMSILESVKIFRKINNTIEIEDGLTKGKTYKISENKFNSKNDEDKNEQDNIKKIICQKLQRLVTRLPIFMYLSEYVEEHIDDVIQYLEPDLFKETTGVGVSDFKILKEANVFNINNLNDAVLAFKKQEQTTLLNKTNIGIGAKTDILDVMANLSNEEVFTPVGVVNGVLDLIPEGVWYDHSLKWFNPACKNGIWLREIYRRLFQTLESIIENKEDREAHIKNNMLYGCAISDLAYKMTCKTIYAWADPNDEKYIRWRESRYINNITNKRFLGERVKDMPKFDIVIGNPPYQESDGGGDGRSATPLYNHFVEKIKDKIDPEFMSFIIPSRWFAGGKGLNTFRKKMQTSMGIKTIKDFPDSKTVFKEVGVGGGVCYFLSEKDYTGLCGFTDGNSNMWDNDLSKYDIIIREEMTTHVLDKVTGCGDFVGTDNRVLPRKQFGIQTFFKDFATNETGIKCYAKGVKPHDIERDKFTDKHNILDKWKVLISLLNAEGYNKNRATIIAKPNEISTETYLVLGAFDTEIEAINFGKYVKTHFFEFLLRTGTASVSFSKDKFKFVPDQLDYTREYTDEYLYEKYNLSQEEMDFIESKFK